MSVLSERERSRESGLKLKALCRVELRAPTENEKKMVAKNKSSKYAQHAAQERESDSERESMAAAAAEAAAARARAATWQRRICICSVYLSEQMLAPRVLRLREFSLSLCLLRSLARTVAL